MKYVMVGSGAVGSYFGAKLKQAGHEVIFVARGAQLRALRERGLTLHHDDEETHLWLVTATDDLTHIGPADYVLISVKAWQVEAIAAQLPLLQGAHTQFLTLQNGVEAPQIVAEQVGIEHTLGGIVRGFFELDAPGVVRHVGVTPTIIFGQMDGGCGPEAQRLFQQLTEAGVYAELTDQIESALWEKFLLVTSLSSVGADTGLTIGQMRSHELTWIMLRNVMQEIVTVAEGRGIPLAPDVVERTLRFVETFPDTATTSMQRDILNNQPSELEAQTGAVVRLGHDAGVATPIHRVLYDRLIPRERCARGLS